MKKPIQPLTITASSPKMIASVLDGYCLNIMEHPADFALLEDLNSMESSENIIRVFDKIKTWAVERTMLTIKETEEEFDVIHINQKHVKVKTEKGNIDVILNSLRGECDTIQIKIN